MTELSRKCCRTACGEPAIWQPVLKLFAPASRGQTEPARAEIGLMLCERHHVECGIDDLISDDGWEMISDSFTKRGFAVPDRSRAVLEFVRLKPTSTLPTDQFSLIAHWFERYLTGCKLQDCPPDQRRELKRAFFAGAWTILKSADIARNRDESGNLNVVGEQILNKAIDECAAFKQSVVEGRE